MRFPLALALSVVVAAPLVSPLAAAELDASSRLDAVTVYPDGATVTRIIQVDLPAGDSTIVARDFPLSLDPSSLRVEGEGAGRLVIGAIDARRPRLAPPENLPEIDRRIEALQDQRGVLDDAIAAAEARRKFALRFAEASPAGLGEKGEARPLSEWRAAFSAVAEEVAAADAAIRAAKLKQRDLDRQIARLEADRRAKPPRKMEVRIDLAAGAATPARFRVSYTVRGARWQPVYDARLTTGPGEAKPSLELVRRAEIVQRTGEDWNDVALSVSTVRTAKGGSAPDLTALLVGFPRPMPAPMVSISPRRSQYAERSVAADAARPEPLSKSLGIVAGEREATVESGGFQVVFRIPGRISVAANQGAKSFRIASRTIEPDLLVRATPALDLTAFLEAAFKQTDEAPLLPGRVAIYRDGIFVGRGAMALTPKDETVRLGFGADDKIKVTRVAVRRAEGSSGFISTSKTDDREFKITVRNGHAVPVRVTVEDRIPVSENDDIKVELKSNTTPPTARNVRDQRGVLAWTFEAAPGATKDIRLAWQVRWPADKSVVYN